MLSALAHRSKSLLLIIGLSLTIDGGVYAAATYKTDQVQALAEKTAAVQQAQQHEGAQLHTTCQFDLKAINNAHAAIKQGFQVQAQIAEDNIKAINRALRSGLIPQSFHAYYVHARARQVSDRAEFTKLADGIKLVKLNLC